MAEYHAYVISEETPHDITEQVHLKHLELITEIYLNEKRQGNFIAIFTEYLNEDEIKQLKETDGQAQNKIRSSKRLEKFKHLINFCSTNKIPIFSIQDRGWYGNDKIRSERYISYFTENYYCLKNKMKDSASSISPVILIGMPHKQDFNDFLSQEGFQVFLKDIFKDKKDTIKKF